MTSGFVRKRIAWSVLGGIAALAAVQLITCQRTNPPVTGEIAVPLPVKDVLRRACYDCHSNETVWPWYSRVAPVSWLLHRDVTTGRHHLNFSEWKSMSAQRRAKKQKAVGKEVERGDMPLWFYLPLHSGANLSLADKELLQSWSAGPPSD